MCGLYEKVARLCKEYLIMLMKHGGMLPKLRWHTNCKVSVLEIRNGGDGPETESSFGHARME